ncbi:MAG: hypothetical protein ABGY21_06165, partial [Pseudomonadota bacterium]
MQKTDGGQLWRLRPQLTDGATHSIVPPPEDHSGMTKQSLVGGETNEAQREGWYSLPTHRSVSHVHDILACAVIHARAVLGFSIFKDLDINDTGSRVGDQVQGQACLHPEEVDLP